MSTRKYVKFAAPYRSKTFNDTHNFLVGENGVLRGGQVTTSGLTVTVQPLSFIQNGGIIDIDSPLSTGIPSSLIAPYSIGVTVTSMIENVSEVVTPVFFQRPEEITENSVVIADWDGQEWRMRPYVQIAGIKSEKMFSDLQAAQGILSGFDTSYDNLASTINVSSGVLVDTVGATVKKNAATSFDVPVAPNANGLGKGTARVDSIVLRRPTDSKNRVGSLKYIKGPSFVPGQIVVTDPGLAANLSTNFQNNCVINLKYTADRLASVYILSGDLYYTGVNTLNLATAPSAFVIASGNVTDASLCENPDGSIDVVYVKDNNTLFYKKISSLGVEIFPEQQLAETLNTYSQVKITSVGNENNHSVHVFVKHQLNLTVADISYVRLDTGGNIATPFTQFINLAANLDGLAIDKDDEDFKIFLAFINMTTGMAYTRTYLADTATNSAPPLQTGPSVELQNEVFDYQTQTLLPTTGVLDLQVIRLTDLKQTYVFWRQFKSAGTYVDAVYSTDIKEKTGYKAISLGYMTNVKPAICVNSLKQASMYIEVTGQPNLKRVFFDLNTYENLYGAVDQPEIEAAEWLGGHLFENSQGDLVIVQPLAPDQFAVSGVRLTTGWANQTLRDQPLTECDTRIASIWMPGVHIYARPLYIGDNKDVQRLYELNHLFANSATVTWGEDNPNELVFLTNIDIHFFNRDATYRIPFTSPTGVTVPDKNVVYTIIPDEDGIGTQEVELFVEEFGEGVLDRHGRRAVPLFWNLGGVLYTKFSPFKIDAGSGTIVIGQGVTQNLLAWLGAPDESPDPNNHGYGSTNYITEATSHNEAIATLDKLFSQLQLKVDPSNTKQVLLTGVDVQLLNGRFISQELANLVMKFEGAKINFETGVIVDAADAPLGINFTPVTIPSGNYQFYSVNLVPNNVDASNRVSPQILVIAGAGNNASLALAPRAPYGGSKKIGQVAVQGAMSGILPITSPNIFQLGTGSGGGSGTGFQKVDVVDTVSTALPTGSVTIDGQVISDGMLVLFTNLAMDNNKVYKAQGTGPTITSWLAQYVFDGGTSTSPVSGDFIFSKSGVYFKDTVLFFDSAEFKNLTNNKIEATLTDNMTLFPIFGVDKNLFKHLIMEYGIERNGSVRTGLFLASTNGIDVSYSEVSTVGVGDTGVHLTAAISGANLILAYTTTNTTFDAKFTRTLRVWQ